MKERLIKILLIITAPIWIEKVTEGLNFDQSLFLRSSSSHLPYFNSVDAGSTT